MVAGRPERLEDCIKAYLGYHSARGYAENTQIQDQRILTRLLKDVGNLQMRYLTPLHIATWFYGEHGLRNEHHGDQYGSKPLPGISETTHNKYRSRLQVFFKWCAQRGIIRKDLLEDVPRLHEPKKRRQQPPPDVLLGLLDSAATPRDRAYLAFAVNSALRASEMLSIRVGDVDLDSGYVYVTIHKGKKDDNQPITSDLDAELRTWMVQYSADLGRPLLPDDYLFPARTGGKIVSTKFIDGIRTVTHAPFVWVPSKPMTKQQRVVQHALAAAGLPTRYEGTHTIRRAVAKAYFNQIRAEEGYDGAVRTVSALLHHESQTQTEHYLGLSAEVESRDRRMRGKPFLTSMVDRSNVVELRPAK
jgi:integrase